jgi:broad specificity phosphatase PhoE
VPAVLLVRHAQASFGSADYDVLSEVGERQVGAVRAAVEARGVSVDRLVCGSLRRQLDTARAWSSAGADPVVDERWNEYDSAAVIAAHGSVPASMEQHDAGPALDSRAFQQVLDEALHGWLASPGFASFRDGAVDALHEVAASLGSGETAVVVTSGGVIAAVCAAVMGLPDAAFVAFNRVAVNGAITKLVSGRSGTTLVSFNEHSFLEPEGLVTYR